MKDKKDIDMNRDIDRKKVAVGYHSWEWVDKAYASYCRYHFRSGDGIEEWSVRKSGGEA